MPQISAFGERNRLRRFVETGILPRMYFAHSTPRKDRADWQPLADHLHAVGGRAAASAGKLGVSAAALLAGLGHDLGKYTLAFDRRLSGSPERVDHSTAGAREVMQAASGWNPIERGMAELVAYAIAGHHAGLPDRNGDSTSLTFRLRDAEIPSLDPVWKSEITLASPGGLPPHYRPHDDQTRRPFQLAFLGRLIFSTLIDADRGDTRAFERRLGSTGSDQPSPRLPEIADTLVARLDRHLDELAAQAGESDLNRLRAGILAHVTGRAEEKPGFYTLTVPTGGGKTLTVTRFAIGHARRWNLDRIIFAIPFTSVIDQAATILKGVLGDDVVLEHHSAVDFADGRAEADFGERHDSREAKMRQAMEDWAAPIVVTTNVQFFESLFSHRPSRCRKLHNIANSVIVLDEAQTIPLKLLRPCLAALDELVRNYGCTVVLCTATQPAVGSPGFEGGLPLGPDSELAPDPPGLHRALRRSKVQMRPDKTTDDDLVAALSAVEQGFVIVNSRRHALDLYRRVKSAELQGAVHLTTRQTAFDRRAIVARIRQTLREGRPCRLVATSLIEAGIDLDFKAGWRALTGLDSLVQAAGRVNREGRFSLDESILTVFEPAEGKPPHDIEGFIDDLRRIVAKHDDLTHPDALRDYFKEVYWRKSEALDEITIPGESGKVRARVLDLFKLNGRQTDFNYRTVGENFRFIESGMLPVIVPRDEDARRALDSLRAADAHAGAVARKLQSHIVQIPPLARAKLIAREHVQFREEARFGDQFATLESDALYNEEIGLLWEDNVYLELEKFIL